MSANGSATCVKRWRVPSRQKTTDERPLNGRFAADERFVVALARRDPNSLRVFHRNGIPILRWRTAWRTALSGGRRADPLPPRLPPHRRPQPAGPRRQAPRNVASILDSARELGIRDAQVGSQRNCTWILGLAGFRVVTTESDGEAVDSRVTIRIERRGSRGYGCSGCGRRTRRVRSARDRTWDDLPWASHPVTLIYAQRRVRCRQCGIRTEAIAVADAKARVTRRLRQQIGVDCQSMPTSHAAVRHGVSWGKARRAEHAFLREWDAHRPRRRPRHLGADEIHRGKTQTFYTVLSDLVHGEVLGLAKDRTETSVAGLLTTCLDARQRAAVEAVCTDRHRPSVNAVAHQWPTAAIVFDTFHVLQHASAALDDVRRQEFFRAGAVRRAFGRGKRWLLLRRWKTVRGAKRGERA